MRHIQLQLPGMIPCDEAFAFRTHAKALVDKWYLIVLNVKMEAGSSTNSTPTRSISQAIASSETGQAEKDATNGAAATFAAGVSEADETTSVDGTMTET